MPGALDTQPRAPIIRMAECALWLALVVLIGLAQSFHPNDHRLNVVAAVLSIAFGIRSFVGLGGALITVLGLLNYSLALFVGVGGAYAAAAERVAPPYLGMAILTGLVFQILTTFVGWRGQPPDQAASLPSGDAASWMARWGLVLLVALIAWKLLGVGASYDGVTEAAAFAAVTFIVVGALFREDVRLVSLPSLVVLGAVAAYVEVFHTGGGRLRIVALACVVGLVASMRFRTLALKWAAVLVTPLMLFYLAQQRLELQEMRSAGASEGRNGLESMLVPIVALARLLEEQSEGFSLAWGWNLLSMPLSFFPESWLPDAPQALGYELVAVYAPTRYGSGYSVAATVAGEAVYNFGLIGVLLGAPVVAWLCNAIDRRVRHLAGEDSADDRAGLVRLALWVAIGGAIADLAWNGWHVYAVRTLLRLPVFMALGALAALHVAHARRTSDPVRTARARAPRLREPF